MIEMLHVRVPSHEADDAIALLCQPNFATRGNRVGEVVERIVLGVQFGQIRQRVAARGDEQTSDRLSVGRARLAKRDAHQLFLGK